MPGVDAHCPTSGAPLSDDTVYPPEGRPTRYSLASTRDHGGGDLTNGERVSSTHALLTRVIDWHQQHEDAKQPALYRSAAAALRKLKRDDDEEKVWNAWAWTALHAHLDAQGYSVEWMLAHIELPCPHCHGPLAWDATRRGIQPRCQVACVTDHYLNAVIEERIEGAYARAFEDTIEISVTH